MKTLTGIVLGAFILSASAVVGEINQENGGQNIQNGAIDRRMNQIQRGNGQMHRGNGQVQHEMDQIQRGNSQMHRGNGQVQHEMDQIHRGNGLMDRESRPLNGNGNGLRTLDRNGNGNGLRTLDRNGNDNGIRGLDLNGNDNGVRTLDVDDEDNGVRTLDSEVNGLDEDNGDRSDRRRRYDRRRRSPRPFFEFGFGFTDRYYYLPPRERIVFIYPVLERVPEIAIFVDSIRVVEPSCIFPKDGFYTLLIPKDRYFREVIARADDDHVCEILKHYIVAEPIIFDKIRDEQTFTTLAGDKIVITKDGPNYYVGDVRISKPSVYQEKGLVIHVIDGDIK